MYDERLEQKGKPLTEAGTGKIPSVAPCYPLLSKYQGGGTILNRHTSPENMINWCPVKIRAEVETLISEGNKVIILNEKIMAVSPSLSRRNEKWRSYRYRYRHDR